MRQMVIFAVVLSFLASLIGTTLVLGVFGRGSMVSQEAIIPSYFFPRQKSGDKPVTPETKEAIERIVRSDELVVQVVKNASPAVVSIVASKDVPIIERYFVDPFGDDPFFKQFFGENPNLQVPQLRQNGTKRQEVSAGSGFIVSADGFIVTNKHVVADVTADFTVLTNDGKKLPAKVLARDPVQDLAILQITGSNLPFLKLADSSAIKIGQTVIAIGNALGEFRNTVSVGVVSGLQRSIVANGGADGPEALQELVQTDAAINPGNSGGPLINVYGEVVAINTAVASGAQSIGFAIPINKVKRDIESVRKTGKIIYPYLGVRYAPVTDDLAKSLNLGRNYGALLGKNTDGPAVVPGGPADRAGLKEGDIILVVAGERIDANRALSAIVQNHAVGEEITLTVFRAGKEISVKVKLDERK